MTDPARLISEHSVTQFSLEARRRAGLFNAVATLYESMRKAA